MTQIFRQFWGPSLGACWICSILFGGKNFKVSRKIPGRNKLFFKHVVAFLRLKRPAKRRTKNMIPNANGCLSISERPDETMMAYQIEDVQINSLDIHASRPWYCTSFRRRGKALPKTRASYKAFESILRSQVPSMLAPRVKEAGKLWEIHRTSPWGHLECPTETHLKESK